MMISRWQRPARAEIFALPALGDANPRDRYAPLIENGLPDIASRLA